MSDVNGPAFQVGLGELLDEYKKLTEEPAAGQAGHTKVLGWDLEYVCGGAIGSFIDQLLIRRLNDFIAVSDHPLIVDCGANIGFSVLNYKRKHPKSKIIAFEADPLFLPLLRRNLEHNGAGDVEIVEAAVWIKDGQAKWYSEGINGSRLAETEMDPGCPTVRTVDLAAYLGEPIDMLKLDIEGAEYDVIMHLGNRLANVRNLCVECHLDQRKIKPFGKLLELLSTEGFNISINSFGPWRDLVRQPKIPPNHWEQYLLVSGWRDTIAPETASTPGLTYMGAAWLEMQTDLEVARNEGLQKVSELRSELERYQSSLICRLMHKLKS